MFTSEQELVKEMSESDLLIFFITNDRMKSKLFSNEFKLAIKTGKAILPVFHGVLNEHNSNMIQFEKYNFLKIDEPIATQGICFKFFQKVLNNVFFNSIKLNNLVGKKIVSIKKFDTTTFSYPMMKALRKSNEFHIQTNLISEDEALVKFVSLNSDISDIRIGLGSQYDDLKILKISTGRFVNTIKMPNQLIGLGARRRRRLGFKPTNDHYRFCWINHINQIFLFYLHRVKEGYFFEKNGQFVRKISLKNIFCKSYSNSADLCYNPISKETYFIDLSHSNVSKNVFILNENFDEKFETIELEFFSSIKSVGKLIFTWHENKVNVYDSFFKL